MAESPEAGYSGKQYAVSGKCRVRIFVDYWNFQLTINESIDALLGTKHSKFPIDWCKFPLWITAKVATLMGNECSYDGMIVFSSHDGAVEGMKHKSFIENTLSKYPGIQVQCRMRKPKSNRYCRKCDASVTPVCPNCGDPLTGTTEKGVDTAIATEMIRLAWEGAYDVAVLVSLDADLVPAAQFLDAKGRKVIQARIPPKGEDLRKACWSSIDLMTERDEYEYR